MEHFACGDLSGSSTNRCPSCSFTGGRIELWDAWDGTLPPSLDVMEGRFTCPFCRVEKALRAAFGAATKVCSKCTRLGHERHSCRTRVAAVGS